MNPVKLSEARRRLERLYWDCHRNGGPDVEVLSILRLVEEAALPDAEPEEEETVYIGIDPPQPAA